MTTDISTLAPRRILACQLRQIGDVIVSTACIELLARRWPEAEIHFLTEAKCAPVLEHNPRLARVWTMDPAKGLPATLGAALALRRQRFDLLVDFQQLPRTGLAAALSHAPVRLAPGGKWYKRLPYTHFGGHARGGYAGGVKASLLEPLGIAWDREPPRLYLTEAERAGARAHLAAAGAGPDDILVGVDATHWSDTRRWPEAHWAAWIGLCLDARPELRFVLLHGPGERECVERIAAASGHGGRCILPPDEPPSLRRAAALIDACTLQVGNCSAPRHMAVALGKPTLTIIGSNGDTAWTFPDKARHRISFHYLPCSKCNHNVCPNGTLECLRGLTPETVTRDFLALLADVASAQGPEARPES